MKFKEKNPPCSFIKHLKGDNYFSYLFFMHDYGSLKSIIKLTLVYWNFGNAQLFFSGNAFYSLFLYCSNTVLFKRQFGENLQRHIKWRKTHANFPRNYRNHQNVCFVIAGVNLAKRQKSYKMDQKSFWNRIENSFLKRWSKIP